MYRVARSINFRLLGTTQIMKLPITRPSRTIVQVESAFITSFTATRVTPSSSKSVSGTGTTTKCDRRIPSEPFSASGLSAPK